MFYVPNGTPSAGSSDSGDGGLPSTSKNLAGLLDEQRKKGIGAAVLTITGKIAKFLPWTWFSNNREEQKIAYCEFYCRFMPASFWS